MCTIAAYTLLSQLLFDDHVTVSINLHFFWIRIHDYTAGEYGEKIGVEEENFLRFQLFP